MNEFEQIERVLHNPDESPVEERRHRIRNGLVNSCINIFSDEEKCLDRVLITKSIRAFLEYFKACLSESPNIFSYVSDKRRGRRTRRFTNQSQITQDTEHKLFSKWLYRTFGLLLLNPRLSTLNQTVVDILESLFKVLSNNQKNILEDAINSIVDMIYNVMKLKIQSSSALWKVSISYDSSSQRKIQAQFHVHDINLNSFLASLGLILPYWRAIESNSLICFRLLEIVKHLFKDSEVEASKKLSLINLLPSSLYVKEHYGQFLLSQSIVEIINMELSHYETQSVSEQKIFNMFLETRKRELKQNHESLTTYIPLLEASLLDLIIDTPFRLSNDVYLKVEIMEFYLLIISLLRERTDIGPFGLSSRDLSFAFLSELAQYSPIGLPIFANTIYKELYNFCNIHGITTPFHENEESKATLWHLLFSHLTSGLEQINEKLVSPVVDENSPEFSSLLNAFKTMTHQCIGYVLILREVIKIQEDLRPELSIDFKYLFNVNSLANFFIQVSRAQDKIDKQVPDGHPSLRKMRDWLPVCCKVLENVCDLSNPTLHLYIMYPYFPSAFLENMDTGVSASGIEAHVARYGKGKGLTNALITLGLNNMISNGERNERVTQVLTLALSDNSPECVKGLLHLFSSPKLVLKDLDKGEVLDFFRRVVGSRVWEDEEIGTLFASSLSKLPCIFSRAQQNSMNGSCPVCDSGAFFLERKRCRQKEIIEIVNMFGELKPNHKLRSRVFDVLRALKRHGSSFSTSTVSDFLCLTYDENINVRFALISSLGNQLPLYLKLQYPNEREEGRTSIFDIFFTYIKGYIRENLGSDELDYEFIYDFLHSFRLYKFVRSRKIRSEITSCVLLMLTVRWNHYNISKCKAIMKDLADESNLKLCEFVGQIREEILNELTFALLGQVFEYENEVKNSCGNCNNMVLKNKEKIDKAQVIIRALETSMEIRHDDFIKMFVPLFLRFVIPDALSSHAIQCFIQALAEYCFCSVKDLLVENFPYYITPIGLHDMPSLDRTFEYLSTHGINPLFLSNINIKNLVCEVMDFFSENSGQNENTFIFRVLSSIILWHKGVSHKFPSENILPHQEIKSFLLDRIVNYHLSVSYKIESPFESVKKKRAVFESFTEVTNFLGTEGTSLSKMRIAKLLDSFTNKEFLLDIVGNGWKAYTFNLETSALPTMMSQILVSCLRLHRKLKQMMDVRSLGSDSRADVLEEIANYIILQNLTITSAFRHHVYFIESHIANRNTVTLIKNARYNGTAFLEFLIKNMTEANTDIRYQALLAVEKIIKREDTSVNFRELLVDTQYVHPLISQLIYALLDCVECGSSVLSKRAGIVFGELSAVDCYRLRVESVKKKSHRDCTGIFPTGLLFCTNFIEMLRKQYQGTELSNPEDIDACALVVQEVFKLYKVVEDGEVWNLLQSDTRVLFHPFLSSKFVSGGEIEPDPQWTLPIYGNSYGKNLREWAVNFIKRILPFVTYGPAKDVFSLTLPLLTRGSLTVSTTILPLVTLFAAMSSNEEAKTIIFSELDSILKYWLPKRDDGPELVYSNPFSYFTKSSSCDMSDEIMDRLSVTNAVFQTIDLISFITRLGSTDFSHINNIAVSGRSGLQLLATSPLIQGQPLDPDMMRVAMRVLPDPKTMCISSLLIHSYQRSLMNLEDYFYVSYPWKMEDNIGILQKIYVALEDIDSIIGLNAIRKNKPTLHQEALEFLATGRKEDAAMQFKEMLNKNFYSFIKERTLIQAYLSIEKPEVALTVISGILASTVSEEVSKALEECRLEAHWRLQQWDDLKLAVERVDSVLDGNWALTQSFILSKFQRKEYSAASKLIYEARNNCFSALFASEIHKGSYFKHYEDIIRLQILNEMESSVDLMIDGLGQKDLRSLNDYKIQVKNFLRNWKDRLGLVQQSLKIVEPIINARKALLYIMKENMSRTSVTELIDPSIRDSLLYLAKLEIRCKNFGRARNCIKEARAFCSAEVSIVEAKFLHAQGDTTSGIRVIKDCLRNYFSDVDIERWENIEFENIHDRESPSTTNADFLQSRICAKALLLRARFDDQLANVDHDVNIHNYTKVTSVYKYAEKNYFHLASYYDKIWEEVKDPIKQSEMLVAVVKNYCKSLEFGSKHIYQSLPRLLHIWFDYSSKIPTKSSKSSSSGQLQQTHMKAVNQMTNAITFLSDNVPVYLFLTAYSQLISRICHPNPEIWKTLKGIIVKIILKHPHQAIWMIIALTKSSYNMRKLRCTEILKDVEVQKSELGTLIRDYLTFGEVLIDLSNKYADSGKCTTIQAISPALVKVLSNQKFSKVLIPFQKFLNITISRVGKNHISHNPFQQIPVYIGSIEKNVEVMSSLQRPKKITFRGTDGRLYGILCKPCDDLRKDSKVMEMNNIVNLYLTRYAEARERKLSIRTYAVVPLNEETGLLEWVPNLQGLRPIVSKIYKEKKLGMTVKELKSLYPTKQMSLEERIQIFKDKFIQTHPPVLREWFRTYFSDPHEWYTAREGFTRTGAVSSMVGYLIGLGDRHGENILLDSTTGDVVHVDFNCLFNKGESFDWPERVPFRLTHNMVDAMGCLGFEGSFRKSCEITMDILRENAQVFMSVITPFVFDPLVEWARVRGQQTQAPSSKNSTGEVQNEKAKENQEAIKMRLEGKARSMTRELNVALSVEAQVNYLITEATSVENLCRMYLGWGSYY